MSRISVLAEMVRLVVVRALAHDSLEAAQDNGRRSLELDPWHRRNTLTGAIFTTRCFAAGRCITVTAELTKHRVMPGQIPPPFSKKWWSLSEIILVDSAGNIEKCSLATLRNLAAKHFWDFTVVGLWDPDEDQSDFFGIFWSEDLQEGRIIPNPQWYSIDAGKDDRFELIHALPAKLGRTAAVNWLKVRRAAWIKKYC